MEPQLERLLPVPVVVTIEVMTKVVLIPGVAKSILYHRSLALINKATYTVEAYSFCISNNQCEMIREQQQYPFCSVSLHTSCLPKTW